MIKNRSDVVATCCYIKVDRKRVSHACRRDAGNVCNLSTELSLRTEKNLTSVALLFRNRRSINFNEPIKSVKNYEFSWTNFVRKKNNHNDGTTWVEFEREYRKEQKLSSNSPVDALPELSRPARNVFCGRMAEGGSHDVLLTSRCGSNIWKFYRTNR